MCSVLDIEPRCSVIIVSEGGLPVLCDRLLNPRRVGYSLYASPCLKCIALLSELHPRDVLSVVVPNAAIRQRPCMRTEVSSPQPASQQPAAIVR